MVENSLYFQEPSWCSEIIKSSMTCMSEVTSPENVCSETPQTPLERLVLQGVIGVSLGEKLHRILGLHDSTL